MLPTEIQWQSVGVGVAGDGTGAGDGGEKRGGFKTVIVLNPPSLRDHSWLSNKATPFVLTQRPK